MKKVLLAGATGYLGGYIAKTLQDRDIFYRAVVRNPAALAGRGIVPGDVLQAELTRPETIAGCCRGMDVVISSVGITRQKDGLTYMDVDYQANMNLLAEARNSGVRKFIYVSVFNGEKFRHLKICDAKERFVDQLKQSGLDCCIIRPNGFFSDMTEFYNMAGKGRVYLFGDGRVRLNPIHGRDLGGLCVDAIARDDTEIRVGGPQTLTHSEIATLAFAALGKPPAITHIPDWVRVATLKLVRLLTRSQTYGPIEFFLTAMATDMVAPEYGECTLGAYFESLAQQVQ